jgi:peptide chain release factor 2
MYRRFAERRGLRVEVVERASGERAGIGSVTLLVGGAFGLLCGEKGMHLRIGRSRFDPQGRRRTDFASVAVSPVVDSAGVVIGEEDLEVESSGTSVRVTHLPTGIVSCGNAGGSRRENRETAIGVLHSRLFELKRERATPTLREHRRVYVLDPHTLVRSHPCGTETTDVGGVLDGDLGPFLGVRGAG